MHGPMNIKLSFVILLKLLLSKYFPLQYCFHDRNPEPELHVSGGTSTHHQERLQLYLQHLVFVTPLLLSAAIVEELEPV